MVPQSGFPPTPRRREALEEFLSSEYTVSHSTQITRPPANDQLHSHVSNSLRSAFPFGVITKPHPRGTLSLSAIGSLPLVVWLPKAVSTLWGLYKCIGELTH